MIGFIRRRQEAQRKRKKELEELRQAEIDRAYQRGFRDGMRKAYTVSTSNDPTSSNASQKQSAASRTSAITTFTSSPSSDSTTEVMSSANSIYRTQAAMSGHDGGSRMHSESCRSPNHSSGSHDSSSSHSHSDHSSHSGSYDAGGSFDSGSSSCD